MYPWTRFWIPRDGTLSLTTDGYLPDPTETLGGYLNPEIVSWNALESVPCVVLLGEPGSGKSTAMNSAFEQAQGHFDKNRVLLFNLNQYQTQDELLRDILEDGRFSAWISDDSHLTLFLDSLDECLANIKTVARRLATKLNGLPVDRMSLRIACRTADWPADLEVCLQSLWPGNQLGVDEIAPLRCQDVAIAATMSGVDAKAFLAEISQHEAAPLATRPVTLNFLLDTYKRIGDFPETRSRLYEEGCRLLCEDTRDGSQVARLEGHYSSEQRMAISARIATLLLLGNRVAVWSGAHRSEAPDGYLATSDVSGYAELAKDGTQVSVDQQAVRETLKTGLFSARGSNRFGFAHQTFGEYLAASYLADHQLSDDQVMSLLTHPEDGKVVPQLRGVAAWFATLRPGALERILEVDPEVLLHGDLVSLTSEDRAAVVDAFLQSLDAGAVLDLRQLRSSFSKLSHAELASQLEPFVVDLTKNSLVRRVAISIAQSCRVESLQEALVNIALSADEDLQVRIYATVAILEIGDEDALAALRPLALGEAGPDPDNELKGYALQATWPEYLTAAELFESLDVDENFVFGAYYGFLRAKLIERLRVDDLPHALAWVGRQDPAPRASYQSEKLIDAVISFACEHIREPSVLPMLTRALWSRLKKFDGLGGPESDFSKHLLDETTRRAIAGSMAKTIPKGTQPASLLYAHPPLMQQEDLPWAISRLLEATRRAEQEIWAGLIVQMFDLNNAAHVDALLVAADSSECLRNEMRYWLGTVQLDSPEADDYRKRLQRDRELWSAPQSRQVFLDPPPAERIRRYLQRVETGHPETWWALARDLELEPDSTHYQSEFEFESDLTILPGWKAASDDTRYRIVVGARLFLTSGAPDSVSVLKPNTWHWPSHAGYKAMRLLMCKDPDALAELPNEIWAKWAPVVLSYPGQGDAESYSAQERLSQSAYNHAPGVVGSVLLKLIERDDKLHGAQYHLRWIGACWDAPLAEILMQGATSLSLHPTSLGQLLGPLLHHHVTSAVEYAMSLIPEQLPPDSENREIAAVAASQLLLHSAANGWPRVWHSIQQELWFGDEVMQRVADNLEEMSDVSISVALTETRLADLYIWMACRYPQEEDPGYGVGNRGGYVTCRHRIAELRDAVLVWLGDKATFQAVLEIRRIIAVLPESSRIKWTLASVEHLVRLQTWIPPHPKELLEIIFNHRTRLVRSGRDLLNLLVESLMVWQERLHGDTPALVDLWDHQQVAGKYRPREETHLSDYIKRHLEIDLQDERIVVGREVVIRRSSEYRQGQNTDVHVTVLPRGARTNEAGWITVIIEVKANWNGGVYKDMERQLVRRYLQENQCKYGLYVAGWYSGEQWDDDDPRKGRRKKLTIDGAQAKLDQQARYLSQGDIEVRALVIDAGLR